MLREIVQILKASEKHFDQRVPLTSRGFSNGHPLVERWYDHPVTKVAVKTTYTSDRYLDPSLTTKPVVRVEQAVLAFERGKHGRLVLFQRQFVNTEDGEILREDTVAGYPQDTHVFTLFTADELLAGAIERVRDVQSRTLQKLDEVKVRFEALVHLRRRGPREEKVALYGKTPPGR